MSNNEKEVQVILWDTVIGYLYWKDDVGYFEYDRNFLKSGIELSPITMPLDEKIYSFSALNTETFKGLPGMLADSLPDKFGNALIDQWLERTGRSVSDFTSADRLCYIGTRGMGALEFAPSIQRKNEESYPLEIGELVELANQALTEKEQLSGELGEEDQERRAAVEHIISVGTSAGGARAKAVIAWNEQTNEIRSGQIYAGHGFDYWLLKFDGVDENKDKEVLTDPKGFGLLEYAYYLMAIDCGIEMSRCRILQEGGRSHFMTKRFDRHNGGDKVHMQSLCGLAHYDFNKAGAYSYEQALGVMRDLQLPNTQLQQFYRRIVFNVIARNQDDHTKNIAFLMDDTGKWRLSPAYDITYCNGEKWTAMHQMSVNGKLTDFTTDDLLQVAQHADISQGLAKRIITEVANTVANWKTFAQQSGLIAYTEQHTSLSGWVDEIARNHRLYLTEFK